MDLNSHEFLHLHPFKSGYIANPQVAESAKMLLKVVHSNVIELAEIMYPTFLFSLREFHLSRVSISLLDAINR